MHLMLVFIPFLQFCLDEPGGGVRTKYFSDEIVF